jgi:hypothetical protein
MEIEMRPKSVMAALKIVFALAAIAASRNIPVADVEKKVKELFG